MIKPLETPELYKFTGYLDALKYFLEGGNYVVWFGVKGFELASSDFSAVKLMQIAYPHSNPSEAKIIERSQSEMIQNINNCLRRSNMHSDPSISESTILENITLGYLNHLRMCIDIDYGESTILEYDEGVDLEYIDIYWRFAYIIHNRQQRRCVIIHGASSD